MGTYPSYRAGLLNVKGDKNFKETWGIRWSVARFWSWHPDSPTARSSNILRWELWKFSKSHAGCFANKKARNLYTSYVGIPSMCIGEHSFFIYVIRSMTVIMIMISYRRNEFIHYCNLGHFDKKKTLPPNALFFLEGKRSCLFHSACFFFLTGIRWQLCQIR